MDMKCADCRFFDAKLGQTSTDGVCRRYAPSPEAQLRQYVVLDETAWWPVVEGDEWCGEFESKQQSLDEAFRRGVIPVGGQ